MFDLNSLSVLIQSIISTFAPPFVWLATILIFIQTGHFIIRIISQVVDHYDYDDFCAENDIDPPRSSILTSDKAFENSDPKNIQQSYFSEDEFFNRKYT